MVYWWLPNLQSSEMTFLVTKTWRIGACLSINELAMGQTYQIRSMKKLWCMFWYGQIISGRSVCKIMYLYHPVTLGHGVGSKFYPPPGKILSLRFLWIHDKSGERLGRDTKGKKEGFARSSANPWYYWCRGTESNCRHGDFQTNNNHFYKANDFR